MPKEREREELPSVVYRITGELPYVVVFPSATFNVRLTACGPSGRHMLAGYDHAHATEALISPNYRSHEALIAAVFTLGIPVRVDTLGATIMRRMVRKRWAVVVRSDRERPWH
jgi:hypothetical protein